MNTSAQPPTVSQETVGAHRRISEAHQVLAEHYKLLADAGAPAPATARGDNPKALNNAASAPTWLNSSASAATSSSYSGGRLLGAKPSGRSFGPLCQATNYSSGSGFLVQPANPPASGLGGANAKAPGGDYTKALNDAMSALKDEIKNDVKEEVQRLRDWIQWNNEAQRVRGKNPLQLVPPSPYSTYTGAWPPNGAPVVFSDIMDMSGQPLDDMLKAYELSDEGNLEDKQLRLEEFVG